MNSLSWILVADASRARIYSVHKAHLFQKHDEHHPLTLVRTFTHVASQEKDTELMTDNLGRFDRSVFIEQTDPKWHEAEVFAHELLHYLEANRTNKSYRDIILVSPPGFMGLINQLMPHELEKCINQRIEKDYTKLDEPILLTHLMTHF